MNNTIKSKADFELLFGKGQRVSTSLMAARIMKKDKQRDHKGRVAFVAGKRTGNAVRRNRCKRVMREAARNSGAPWDGYDVVLIARNPGIATAPHEKIQRECDFIASKISAL